jgi:hypothetical protein
LQERDLTVAVLSAQAGFVSPSEVLAVAAAGLVDDLATGSPITRAFRCPRHSCASLAPSEAKFGTTHLWMVKALA